MQGPKKRYSLTTQPPGQAGVDVAKALHHMAHQTDRMAPASTCRCGLPHTTHLTPHTSHLTPPSSSSLLTRACS
jgi:hypothetical protein